jgi:putative transposase
MTSTVLTDESTLETVLECLVEHIPIDMQGACDPETLFAILVRAASTNDSVEHTCALLEDVPCGNDIRDHLEQYQVMRDLEEALNRAFQSRLPWGMTRRRHRLACDLNLVP